MAIETHPRNDTTSHRTGRHTGRVRRMLPAGLALGALTITALAGCSSSGSTSAPPTSISPTTGSSTSGSPTTAAPKNLSIITPEGQVTLSLDGQLPPGWPTAFPVPIGATPAGSGSVGSTGKAAAVAVFDSSQTPQQTFEFYRTSRSMTVSSAKAVGAGSAYIGRVTLTRPWSGSVTVIPDGSGSRAVVVLKSTATSTSPSTTA